MRKSCSKSIENRLRLIVGMDKIKEIFKLRPTRWGLRGDSVLWEKMCDTIGDFEIPTDKLKLQEILTHAYEKHTGKPIGEGGEFYVEELRSPEPGGMSSGWVSSEWWQEVGIPFLIDKAVNLIDETYIPCWKLYYIELTKEQWDLGSDLHRDAFFPTKLKPSTPEWIVERYKVEHPDYENEIYKLLKIN